MHEKMRTTSRWNLLLPTVLKRQLKKYSGIKTITNLLIKHKCRNVRTSAHTYNVHYWNTICMVYVEEWLANMMGKIESNLLIEWRLVCWGYGTHSIYSLFSNNENYPIHSPFSYPQFCLIHEHIMTWVNL